MYISCSTVQHRLHHIIPFARVLHSWKIEHIYHTNAYSCLLPSFRKQSRHLPLLCWPTFAKHHSDTLTVALFHRSSFRWCVAGHLRSEPLATAGWGQTGSAGWPETCPRPARTTPGSDHMASWHVFATSWVEHGMMSAFRRRCQLRSIPRSLDDGNRWSPPRRSPGRKCQLIRQLSNCFWYVVVQSPLGPLASIDLVEVY